MNRSSLVLVLAVVLAGCGFITSPTTTATSEAPVIETVAPVTTFPAVDPEATPPCLAGDKPFASDGVISAFGGANGDATQVAGIRWAAHPGCERVVIDLLTADGAPAGAIDPVGVDFRAEEGVVRINLPDAISRSAIADSLFDGELIYRAYVVATDNGGIAIDVHATPGTKLALRAFEVTSPSRIVVDVRPETDAQQVAGAAVAAGVVVVSPQPTQTEAAVSVSGYARGPGNEITVGVFAEGDTTALVEETVELTGDPSLWREFTIQLADLPRRPLEIAVGFGSADTTADARVSIDITDRQTPDPPDV